MLCHAFFSLNINFAKINSGWRVESHHQCRESQFFHWIGGQNKILNESGVGVGIWCRSYRIELYSKFEKYTQQWKRIKTKLLIFFSRKILKKKSFGVGKFKKIRTGVKVSWLLIDFLQPEISNTRNQRAEVGYCFLFVCCFFFGSFCFVFIDSLFLFFVVQKVPKKANT